MKRTNRLILLIGVLLAVVAFVGIVVVFNNQSSSSTQPVVTASVVVASRDIKLGDTIADNQVSTQQIPLGDKKPDQFSQPGEVVGQVARTDVAKGQFLTQSMFTGTGAPTIAKDLPAGMRAMAVRVDAVTGVGTLILVGDRVDLVITLAIKPVTVVPVPSGPPTITAQDALTGDSSKVIIQNVEVRAVLGASAGTAEAGSTTAQAPADLASAQQVVILGLSPQQAEVVEFLQQEAKAKGGSTNNITLVLRSPQDKNAPADTTTGIVLSTLIKDYGVLPPGILEASLPPTR